MFTSVLTQNACARMVATAFLVVFALCGLPERTASADESRQVVAVVNGKRLTAEDLQLPFYLRALPQEADETNREKLLNDAIDRELIRQFLRSRRITASPDVVDHRMALIQKAIAQQGETLDDVLKRLHLNEKSAREILQLPLAWERYVQSRVTESQIRSIWETRRRELDGTRVTASQIVLFLPPDASEEDWKSAESRLNEIRDQIVSGKMTFEQAAEAHSQSPSARRGGDLGEFEFSGQVDESISRVAFNTPPGEVSHPFRSRSGVHIVKTKSVIPGQLVLEDARPEILEEISRELWSQQVHELREKASIQILLNK